MRLTREDASLSLKQCHPCVPLPMLRSRQNGATALNAAAERGHDAVVRLLLKHEARVDAAVQVQAQSLDNS
jgi:ankyrin repeat protein